MENVTIKINGMMETKERINALYHSLRESCTSEFKVSDVYRFAHGHYSPEMIYIILWSNALEDIDTYRLCLNPILRVVESDRWEKAKELYASGIREIPITIITMGDDYIPGTIQI